MGTFPFANGIIFAFTGSCSLHGFPIVPHSQQTQNTQEEEDVQRHHGPHNVQAILIADREYEWGEPRESSSAEQKEAHHLGIHPTWSNSDKGGNEHWMKPTCLCKKAEAKLVIYELFKELHKKNSTCTN
jgi:hypothetical protein